MNASTTFRAFSFDTCFAALDFCLYQSHHQQSSSRQAFLSFLLERVEVESNSSSLPFSFSSALPVSSLFSK